MHLRAKIAAIFNRKEKPIRGIATEINTPKSTVHYHKQQTDKRIDDIGTDFWETDLGYQFIIRLVVAAIFVFCIKSGNGAGRLSEFFRLLQLDNYLPASESVILKIIKQIEALILGYRNASEREIRSKVKQIELILGVDETWFDKMYLVCQELSSGYIFFETESDQKDATTWNEHIKKTLHITSNSSNQVFC